MTPTIRVIQGPDEGKSLAIGSDRFLIGRKNGDLLLADREVSGTHCLIECEEGRWYVADLGSTNGTWLGARRVSRAEIGHGTILQVGTSSLLFELPQARPEAQADISQPVPEPEVELLPGAAYLLLLKGADPGRVYPVRKDVTTLGRGRADITLRDEDVSRRHAAIERTGEGHFLLRDLGSRNGSFLNGIRVGVESLADNDHIRLGGTLLKFVIGGERLKEEKSRLE